jgi:hypothetical protein
MSVRPRLAFVRCKMPRVALQPRSVPEQRSNEAPYLLTPVMQNACGSCTHGPRRSPWSRNSPRRRRHCGSVRSHAVGCPSSVCKHHQPAPRATARAFGGRPVGGGGSSSPASAAVAMTAAASGVATATAASGAAGAAGAGTGRAWHVARSARRRATSPSSRAFDPSSGGLQPTPATITSTIVQRMGRGSYLSAPRAITRRGETAPAKGPWRHEEHHEQGNTRPAATRAGSGLLARRRRGGCVSSTRHPWAHCSMRKPPRSAQQYAPPWRGLKRGRTAPPSRGRSPSRTRPQELCSTVERTAWASRDATNPRHHGARSGAAGPRDIVPATRLALCGVLPGERFSVAHCAFAARIPGPPGVARPWHRTGSVSQNQCRSAACFPGRSTGTDSRGRGVVSVRRSITPSQRCADRVLSRDSPSLGEHSQRPRTAAPPRRSARLAVASDVARYVTVT